MNYKLGERWLLFNGIEEKELQQKYHRALYRAGKYPFPHRYLFVWVIWLINSFGAFFLMGKFARASQLNDNDFETLIVKLKEHRFAYVRIIGMLLWQPFVEVLREDIEISNLSENNHHPLLKSPNLIAEGQSLYSETEFVIIGSGAGGAPLAYELSKNGRKVIVIEKGDIVKSETTADTLEKHYVGQALTVSVTGAAILVMAGSAVGGTTPVNSGTCLKPHSHCLEKWDQQLHTSFASGELDSFLKKAEEQIKVCVPHESLLSQSAVLFEKGLEKCNRQGAFILPRNAENCQAKGRCCFGCPTMVKQSTDIAYLPDALKNSAQLWIKSKVYRIEEKKDGVEVYVESNSGKHQIHAKHLIISAGALLTPGLLLKNKLGANRNLIGKNLKIHPAGKVFAYFPQYDFSHEGIPQCMGYYPPEIPRVTLEAIHTPESIIGPIISAAGKKFTWWMNNAQHLASFGLMIHERGKGWVKEFFDLPWIYYSLNKEDAADFVKGLKIIAQAFFAMGAEKVLMPFVGNIQKEFTSAKELESIIPEKFNPMNLMVSGFHPQGTAGMGRVVDTNLQLYGSKRIYVCDASVLPESPGVNPQLTIMALSLRLADHILKSTK